MTKRDDRTTGMIVGYGIGASLVATAAVATLAYFFAPQVSNNVLGFFANINKMLGNFFGSPGFHGYLASNTGAVVSTAAALTTGAVVLGAAVAGPIACMVPPQAQEHITPS